jgi:Domain of unknown function (DUF4404)
MAQRDLHQLLTELHEQLLAAPALGPGDRDLLHHVEEDIRALAAGTRPTEARAREMQSRVADSIAAFEASYPQLSKTLASVIDTLALYNI